VCGTPPQDPGRDHQDDDRPDQSAQHPAPVENIGVANAETDREDQVADQGPDQADPSDTSQDTGPLMFRKASPGTSMRATMPQNRASRIAPIMVTPRIDRAALFTVLSTFL
jgi:hypothetical protein